jgi:hypothetical protein
VIERLLAGMDFRPGHTAPDQFLIVRWSESVTYMKTIATPVAELLAQLHDHAADVVKLIEAIPALKGDDLPQIVNRVHMLGKLKELEAEFPANRIPSDDYLRTRVRLLQAHRRANDNLGYGFRAVSNKALATSVELLRKIGADQLHNWTDIEIEDAIAKLQGERRQRKRNPKPAAEVPAALEDLHAVFQEEELDAHLEEPDDAVAGRSWTRGQLRVIN